MRGFTNAQEFAWMCTFINHWTNRMRMLSEVGSRAEWKPGHPILPRFEWGEDFLLPASAQIQSRATEMVLELANSALPSLALINNSGQKDE